MAIKNTPEVTWAVMRSTYFAAHGSPEGYCCVSVPVELRAVNGSKQISVAERCRAQEAVEVEMVLIEGSYAVAEGRGVD